MFTAKTARDEVLGNWLCGRFRGKCSPFLITVPFAAVAQSRFHGRAGRVTFDCTRVPSSKPELGAACGLKRVISLPNLKSPEGEISLPRNSSRMHAGHSLSCPQMTRMVAQGKSGGKVMFLPRWRHTRATAGKC